MHHNPLPDNGAETIADRFHHHLKIAGQSRKEHRLLPFIKQGDATTATPSLPIAIYLDNVRSAHNVGSILRTVEAFALGEVFFSEGMVPPDHKQVQDAAMGAAEWVRCTQNTPLESLPGPIIALETGQDAVPIHAFTFPESFTLVVGNEEYGCSESTLRLADHIIKIPLFGRKNSLNVANAFAIAAGAIRGQKEPGEE